MEQQTFYYNNKIIKYFAIATVVWGVVGMLVGVIIALQLAFPVLNFGIDFLTYGRLRPIHTNAVIFAFVGNAIFAGLYYSMQRLLKARVFSDILAIINFWGWQLIIVAAAVTLALGFTTTKEYAELEWPVDILIAVVWVVYCINLFGTIAKRRVKHLYVSIWFYIATVLTIAMLHIFNSLEIPVSFFKSYIIYAGVQDAIVQWWYGHNAVAFFLTTPFLGLMYYFVPKAANRPVYSYRLSILHFWTLIFLYIWAGPHHLLYQAVPDWVQSLAVVFSIMLIAPSWGGMVNGLLTLRGAWDKVRESAILKFYVVGITAYGMSTLEGPILSLKNVNAISHFTDWTVGHAHIGALAWNGFLTFGMLYWLFPRIFKTKLFSEKLANIHFWISTLGILFYAIPLYWSAFTQTLMWKQFTEDGLLAYPNFLETVTRLIPMYITRAFGGALYLSGMVLLIYNLIKTAKSGNFSAEEQDSAVPYIKEKITGEKGHSWLESKPFRFAIIAFIAVAIGGLIQILPIIFIKSNVPTIESVKPYTPLELQGRDIYIANGCATCHSQMVRPFRSETERYGEYSKVGEFVYDHPHLWGSKRNGPDLARAGDPTGKMFKTASWHYNHFLDPKTIDKQSIMPKYQWLIKRNIDTSTTAKKIRVMMTLGVPYPEGYDKIANQELLIQAKSISSELKNNGITVEPTKQVIAMIAYLHRLGADIAKNKNASAQSEKLILKPGPFTDEKNLASGKEIFIKNCIVCHGQLGEGNKIGPNLTDNYWIHGGSNDDIYTIIVNGMPAKGMQAWKFLLNEEDVKKVTSYVISLIGSNPPNAKEKQGELFERK